MAAQLYFTDDAPTSRFFSSWDLDLALDVLQVGQQQTTGFRQGPKPLAFLPSYAAVCMHLSSHMTHLNCTHWPGMCHMQCACADAAHT
jgi:hypothetical protein